jgi:hypothetical protein
MQDCAKATFLSLFLINHVGSVWKHSTKSEEFLHTRGTPKRFHFRLMAEKGGPIFQNKELAHLFASKQQ